MLCVIHCGIHPPKCVVHCGVHPPKDIDDVACAGCRTSPYWSLAVSALRKAKDAGLVTREDWEGLLELSIYSVAEVNALAAIIALACGNCLTKEVFG